MKSRLFATVVAAVAMGSLTACGSSPSDTATSSPQTAVTTVVTVTRAPITTPLPATTPDTTDATTSTLQPAPTTTVTAKSDDGSDYVGHFQRHESTLDLAPDGTGSLLMGANALDGERWMSHGDPSNRGSWSCSHGGPRSPARVSKQGCTAVRGSALC